MREEGDEEGVIAKLAAGRDVPAIDIDHVADALEGIEGDAGRQHDLQDRHGHVEVHGREHRAGIAQEKARVLKDAEEQEIAR